MASEDTQGGNVLQFQNILLITKNGSQKGVYKMNKNGLGWKAKATTKSIAVKGADVVRASWIKLAKVNQLKLLVKGGTTYQLNGFAPNDFNTLSNWMRDHFDVTLSEQPYPLKAWNWGDFEFDDRNLIFKVNDQDAFTLPMSDVAQCFVQNKSEVSLEFHQDDSLAQEADTLVEMRFYIPEAAAPKDVDKNETAVSYYHKKFLAMAEIDAGSGGGLLQFKGLQCLVPRGKYDIDIFPKHLKLHGRTHDYKISLTSIYQLHELPRPGYKNVFYVLSLDAPISQGRTSYPHLVFQFGTEEDKIEMDVNLKDFESKLPKDHKFTQKMKGRPMKIFKTVLTTLTGKTFVTTTPKNGPEFKSTTDAPAIKCSFKLDTNGFLYLLEKAFLYLPKPTTILAYSDVTFVEFGRMSSGTSTSTRTFDFIVHTKNGSDYAFTGIARPESNNLYHFMESKGITAKITTVNEGEGNGKEEDEGEEREKGEGRRGGRSKGGEGVLSALGGGGMDEDSEDDEDFMAKDEEDEDDEMDMEPLDKKEVDKDAIITGKRRAAGKADGESEKKKKK
eukprot:TRINITY_DN27066_c0_g1_i1.p1 TRINITY_DN27066_c0_g1~~TRINITY_DN27066_c0_g1_i1.p1  ORF type:complete len:558 (-),score=161.05 TRINITY_DN27066_c0_g1_i1:62-1735(-)